MWIIDFPFSLLISPKKFETGESTKVINAALLKNLIPPLLFEMGKSRKSHIKVFVVYDGLNFPGQLKALVEKPPL